MSAQELVDALEDHGFDPEAYSGRAMFGAQCVGIRMESESDLWRLANDLGLSEIKIAPPRTDSLGRDIIAYWPAVHWPVSA